MGNKAFLTSCSEDDVAFSLLLFSKKNSSFMNHAVCFPGFKPISRESRQETCQKECRNKQELVSLAALGPQVLRGTNVCSVLLNVFHLNKQWEMPEPSAAAADPGD